MQFRLPQQLQNELVAYDPTLKALAKQTTRKSPARKSKSPLGQPADLIPTDVVRQADLNGAIDLINAEYAPNRYHSFKRLKNVATEEAASVTHAIIYHYERVWYAAWLPPEGKEDEYLYGFSFAYKDTATCRKSLPSVILKHAENTESVQYGRSYFRFFQKYVTKQDIINGFDARGWNLPMVASYHEKSRDMRKVIQAFEEDFKAAIPVWEDSHGLFDRVRAANLGVALFERSDLEADVCAKILATPDWTPSYQSFQQLVLDHINATGYAGEPFKYYNRILHIIDKPFFRKWIQERCNECIEQFNDPATKTLRSIKRPWRLIHEFLHRIYQVNEIWPDCPIDYYQSHINVLLGTRWNLMNRHGALDWIREHMPVASFFSNLTKFYEKKMEESLTRSHSYYYSTNLAISQFSFSDWDDTCSMINSLLEHGKEVPIPKRWRMEEFHDTIQAEAWKIRNPNEKLPQDLFPNPIKVTQEGNTWTFFQPSDTHQLALWGQAVRNCVGSASGYAEGVRKKKHFLVLCMVDNRPHFTVQLDVDMGMMSVKQIAGLSNSHLGEQEKDVYTKVFGEALKLREAELAQ